MATEIAPLRDGDLYAVSQRAPVYSRSADDVVRRLTSGADTTRPEQLFLLELPNEQDRGVLRARQISLLKCMDDHDRNLKASLIADMLGCYGTRSGETRDDLRKIIVKFVQELRHIPTWAVARACMAIKSGAAPDIAMDRRPTTIQVVSCANGYLTLTRQELRQIAAVLAAKRQLPPISEEERERVGRAFKDMQARLVQTTAIEHQDLVHRVGERMRSVTNAMIQNMWARCGQAPMQCGELMVSPLLAENIREHRKGAIAMGKSPEDLGS